MNARAGVLAWGVPIALLLSAGCPAPATAPAPALATASAVHPAATVSSAAAAPSAASSAPAPEEPAFSRPKPALERAALCDDGKKALAEVLGRYPRDFEDRSRGTVEVEDLATVAPRTDAPFGDPSSGPGYWGPLDIDGDGKQDLILRYESVDFWSYLFFVAKGPCFRFAGNVEAYQVQLVALPGGKRAARALLYPTGPARRVESLVWTGSAFVRKP